MVLALQAFQWSLLVRQLINYVTCRIMKWLRNTSVEVRNVGGVCRLTNKSGSFLVKMLKVTQPSENRVILRVRLVWVGRHHTGMRQQLRTTLATIEIAYQPLEHGCIMLDLFRHRQPAVIIIFSSFLQVLFLTFGKGKELSGQERRLRASEVKRLAALRKISDYSRVTRESSCRYIHRSVSVRGVLLILGIQLKLFQWHQLLRHGAEQRCHSKQL